MRRRSGSRTHTACRTVQVSIDLTINGLDRSPRAGLISVNVLGASRVVLDVNRLDVVAVRTSRVVSEATSPLNSTRSIAGIAASPRTKSNLHGRLWVVASTRVGEGSNCSSVNVPNDSVTGPVNSVSMHGSLRTADRVESTTVISSSITLGEVVGLDLRSVTSNPFNINFVEIVRDQDHGRHDSSTRSSLSNKFQVAKHDVKVRLHSWGIALLANCEINTLVTISNLAW